MAANIRIVLPSLNSWAEEHLTALFTETDQTAFGQAFDAFVAANPDALVVNGQSLTRAQFKTQLWQDKFLEAGAQVKFLGAVSSTSNTEQPVTAGEVGVFFQATIDERILVMGAPQTRTITFSMNLVVIQDPTLTPPPVGPIHGFFDGRRVASLTAVSTTDPRSTLLPLPTPAPVNPRGPIQPPTVGSST